MCINQHNNIIVELYAEYEPSTSAGYVYMLMQIWTCVPDFGQTRDITPKLALSCGTLFTTLIAGTVPDNPGQLAGML